MARDPIAEYHDLLDDELAGESNRELVDQLERRGLTFGGRPLCTVLRPRFFSTDEYRSLRDRLVPLLRAFKRAHNAALERRELLDQFQLTDWERSLVTVNPGFRDPSPTSRIDAFLVEGGGMRLTEYNAETPAGAGFNDALTDTFYSLPVMRRFGRRWDVRPIPARPHVLHALLEAYEQWSGRTPRRLEIAIVDWRDVPTTAEFLLFQRYFNDQGHGCSILDPEEIEYAGGVLRDGGGKRIDVIYKRVLLHELVDRGGIDHPILRAVRDRAVCMVNPPSCKILHKKASLAVLSDERNAHLFESDMRQAIDDAIPWTRVVEERMTTRHGRSIDLIPFIAGYRHGLVLKPNDEYGGKGIVLGWEVDDETWQTGIATALREPYIVQQRIALPSERYPSYDADHGVVFADRLVDTAPYVTYGDHVDGCLTRLGTTSLLNVTAGGGSQAPTFIAEPR
jgi:glutathionylspermidine synthase